LLLSAAEPDDAPKIFHLLTIDLPVLSGIAFLLSTSATIKIEKDPHQASLAGKWALPGRRGPGQRQKGIGHSRERG
jgi:hypothetical protein